MTPNVVKALTLDAGRRKNLVDKYVPKMLRNFYYDYAGITGAGLARGEPKVGERRFLYFVFRKKDTIAGI